MSAEEIKKQFEYFHTPKVSQTKEEPSSLRKLAEALGKVGIAVVEAIDAIKQIEAEAEDPDEIVERVPVKEMTSGRIHLMPITRRQQKIRAEEDKGPRQEYNSRRKK